MAVIRAAEDKAGSLHRPGDVGLGRARGNLAFVLAADQARFLPVIGQLVHRADKVAVVGGIGGCFGDQVVEGGAVGEDLVSHAAVAAVDHHSR